MSKGIRLSAHREGDDFVIRDQDGRKLELVTGIVVETGHDEATRLTISCLDGSVKDGGPHVNRDRG